MRNETAPLLSPAAIQQFYEDRYERGYMDGWPARAKARVRELVASLELPASGAALDFGCGNGAFAKVLSEALPGWSICGTDLSVHAIRQAAARAPGCSFFRASEGRERGQQFDLVFSHHVLEHVHDLEAAADEMVAYLKPAGFVFNVLPCGNPGSLERSLCALRRDGIDATVGKRFFFEDPGHVRRLTSGELIEVFRERGFSLMAESYSNHEYGAVEWITESLSPRLIFTLTDPRMAVDDQAAEGLRSLRRRLLAVWALRMPACQVHMYFDRSKRRLLDYLVFLGCLPFYPFSEPMDRSVRLKAEQEWQTRRRDPAGSAMYLLFQRTAG